MEAGDSRTLGFVMIFLALAALVIISNFSMFLKLDHQVTQAQEEEYGLAVNLENVLSLDAEYADLEQLENVDGYNYRRRRSVIPIEYFTHSYNSDAGVGYKVNNGHCYLPSVTGLDGEETAFYLKTSTDIEKNTGGDYRQLPDTCTSVSEKDTEIFSPALLVRKVRDNPPVTVNIYVYSIPE